MKTISTTFLYSIIIALLIVGCNTTAKKKLDDSPRRLELLFLGHESEHHNSRVYEPILAASLAPSGINLTYTENVEDLNAEKLALYDGVIMYANHEDSYPDQEKALFDYVAEGHAFIPIHCASFCFKDSPEYVNLVGGQFKSHDTATFTATIVDKTNPIMKHVKEFSTWDETYVHDKLAKDINILMERQEGDGQEPWTWVKNYGKGKVFYTAYGHDERTWTHPEFQNLIKEGILWAVSDVAKRNWEAFSKAMPKLVYKEADNIPNYEKRDPAPKYQMPLSPEDSKKLIQVPAGFELQLFASEPDIINPIAMNWDEKGRLWVIETVDYPNTVRDDKSTGDDRIKILEDTNGDGKADKVTVFADKLNIPTSFAFSNAGIIVSQAPYFLFLKDTDGDDKADVKEILIDGWGTFDTHAGPSNLQNGVDNKIYGVVGYSGFKGTISGKPQQFSQGVYRFNPDVSDFEFVTNTSNNTWGLGFTEDHAIFASTANNTHSVFVGIPNKNIDGIKGIGALGSLKIDGHYAMHPITPNIRQVDVFGGFTAAAGHHFYTARDYPKEYWNKMAFVCEPTGGLVHLAKIEKVGAGYIETDGGNLFASSDEWVSPVEAKVGPDGNVWVLDWYNFIIQHNPTPTKDRGGYDAETGNGNAYVNPLRDKSRGRIWKIIPKNVENKHVTSLDKADEDALMEALSNDNMFWRQTAQRLLVERKKTDVLKDLYNLANNKNVDALGLNPGTLHALWTIQGLTNLETNKEARSVITNALTSKSGAIRRAAIQILPKNNQTDQALLKANVLRDADPAVQLAALNYFTERPENQSVGNLLYDLSKKETIINDMWLSTAVYAAATKHKASFIAQFLKSEPQSKEPTDEEKKQRELADYDDSKWKTMVLPQAIEAAGLNMDGVIWFRKTVNLSNAHAGTISLGPIDETDLVYINGKKVGGMINDWETNRVYNIPKGILTTGKNVISVRVEDLQGGGGFVGSKEQMFLKTGNTKVALDGDWNYDIEADLSKSGNLFANKSIAEVLYDAYKDEAGLSVTEAASASAKDATIIHIKTIPNEMKYDIKEFVVEAGKPVELIFENVDFMQHNLVIVQKGQKEKVGLAADKLAMDPAGANINYVPKMPEVLYATAIINPEGKVTLKFVAPTELGVYPYICTFPGHWRIMQGEMKVVKKK